MNTLTMLKGLQVPETTEGNRLSHSEGKYFAVILAALSALAYAGTIRFQFVYDDLLVIVDNPALRSWRFIPQFFTRNVWAGVNTTSHYYRPLHLVWLRLNYALFGPNPTGWHVTSIVVHVVATILVFKFVYRVLGELTTAGFAALIFALHPIQVQSVTWISGSTDPIVTIFLLGGFLAYLNFRSTGKKRWLLASLLAYAGAALTKETGVMLPAIIFAHECLHPSDETVDSWLNRTKRGLRAVLPYFAVVAAYLAARIHALGPSASINSQMRTETLWTLPSVLWLYTKHLLLPWGYSLLYDIAPVQHVVSRTFFVPTTLLILTLVATIALCRWLKLSAITISTATIWLVIPLLPALYLPAVDREVYGQDRYLYLSTAGFAMLVGAAIRAILPQQDESRGSPKLQIYAAVILAGTLMSCSMIQEQYWVNNAALFRRALSIAPHNPEAMNNLAVALAARDDTDGAIALFDRAIRENPVNARLNYNYGSMLYRMGHYEAAVQSFSRAMELDSNLAVDALLYTGMSHMKLGRVQDARAEIAQAISLQADKKGAHLALSAVLEAQGDKAGAIRETRMELSNYPDDQSSGQRLSSLLQEPSSTTITP